MMDTDHPEGPGHQANDAVKHGAGAAMAERTVATEGMIDHAAGKPKNATGGTTDNEHHTERERAQSPARRGTATPSGSHSTFSGLG